MSLKLLVLFALFLIFSYGINKSSAFNCSKEVNPYEDFPCGTFKKYDAINARTDPDCHGFAGGIDYDGTEQFVGYGDNKVCNQIPSSGFISTGHGNKSAGAYLPCCPLSFDNETAFYLLKHPNLKWVPTNAETKFQHKNAVTIEGNYKFAFGRVYYEGEYRLGKLHYDIPDNQLYLMRAGGSQTSFSKKFEILTCA